MRKLFLLLLCSLAWGAEDVLVNQPGVTIPAGTWTNITSTVGGLPGTKFEFYVTGWDKAFYVPSIDRFCQLSSTFNHSSEPNSNWYCYSFVEHRWDLWSQGGPFHDEHQAEGGHPVGFSNIDPTTGVALGPCCFSGSQVSEQIKWGMWKYDFLAQVGIPQVTFGGLEQDNQLGTATYDPFDQLLIGFGGSQSNGGQGHVQYDNNPAHTTCTTVGSNCYNSWVMAPSSVTLSGLNPNIEYHSMAMNNSDKKVYLFGGFYSAVAHNGVWTYTPATSIWTNVFPDATTSASCHDSSSGNNCPVGRNEASWAYDDHANIFLLHGGCTGINISGCTSLTDTWIYDPIANTFTQLNPGTVPTYATGVVPNERLVYMKEDDVYLLSTEPTTSVALWAFRLAPGGNAGSRTNTYSSPTGLNHYTSSSTVQSWAYGTAVATNGGTTLNSWTESNNQYTPTPGDSWLFHPYAQSVTSNVVTAMPSPFANSTSYAAISPNISTNVANAYQLSETNIGGVPWVCTYQIDYGEQSYVRCVGFSGGSWSLGGTVPDITSQYDGQVQIIGVGSTPTIIFKEQDRTTGNIPYPTYIHVAQWNGSAWVQLGGALNSGFSMGDSPTIGTDGTNIWTSFVFYGSFTSAASGSNGVFIGPSQVVLFKWNGTTWVQQGGTGNVASNSTCTGLLTGNPPTYIGSSCSRAFGTSLTVLNGTPYVAFAERTDQGILQKGWVRSYSSGWATIGSFFNKDQLDGFVFKPKITNDGTNLFIAWAEQGNPQTFIGTSASPANSHYARRPQVYVAQLTPTGTLSYLGGSLNMDTFNGAATQPDIAMLGTGQPVVEWGEVQAGQNRQAYTSQWTGTTWVATGTVTSTLPNITTTSPLPQATDGVAYSTTLAATNGPITWAVSFGALPSGLSLNSTTGVISGTPTGATTSFTISATNSSGSSSAGFTLPVVSAPTITSASPLSNGQVGLAYNNQLMASGSIPITWAITSGTLPNGLSLSSGGLISGTPGVVGSSTFGVTATNSVGSNGKTFSLTINPAPPTPPTITSSSPLPGGTQNVTYSTTIAVTGTSPITCTVTSGSLPTGLSLGLNSCILGGIPSGSGTSTFTITATNAAGSNPKAFSLTITAAVVPPTIITLSPLPPGIINSFYSTTITASGSTPITWAIVAGALPTGFSLNTSTGIISGTTAIGNTYNFTISATNSAGSTNQAFSLAISASSGVTISGTVILSGSTVVK
jgi:hypothetical protein